MLDKMPLSKKSEYFSTLPADTRHRYECKILTAGLSVDPYTIEDSQWSREPESIPQLSWSDVVLYMVSTPSPHTKESIKVCTNIFMN